MTEVRLPEKQQQHAKELGGLLESEIPKWRLPISMDRLLTSLDLAETTSEASARINTAPPRIVCMTDPSMLISIDGEPRIQQLEGAKLLRAINTPFTILLDPTSKTHYLNADADTWYQASDILGVWSLVKQVPKAVSDRAPKVGAEPDAKEDNAQAEETGPPPTVVVATEPTEPIVAKGKPEFTPITGTELLFMSNTDSDLMLDVSSQQTMYCSGAGGSPATNWMGIGVT